MTATRIRRHGLAVALVAIGGVLGAVLRYAAGAAAGDALLVTLVVNATGSFALGLVLFDARADEVLSRRFRYLFGTGFLSSFTTYSTFVADAAMATPAVAIVYVVASYTAGFGAVLVSRRVVAARSKDPIAPVAAGED